MFFNPPSLKLKGILDLIDVPLGPLLDFQFDTAGTSGLYEFSSGGRRIDTDDGAGTSQSRFAFMAPAIPVGQWYFEVSWRDSAGDSAFGIVMEDDRFEGTIEDDGSPDSFYNYGVGLRKDGRLYDPDSGATDGFFNSWGGTTGRLGIKLTVPESQDGVTLEVRATTGGSFVSTGVLTPLGWSGKGVHLVYNPEGTSDYATFVLDEVNFDGAVPAGFTPLGEARGSPAGGTPSVAHRYWRVFVPDSVGSSYSAIAEVEFRAGVGGAILTNPADVAARTISSGFVNNWDDEHAFDQSAGTTFENSWASHVAAIAKNVWVGWDFTTPTVVTETTILTTEVGAFHPLEIYVEGSDDLSTWVRYGTLSGPFSDSTSYDFASFNQATGPVELFVPKFTWDPNYQEPIYSFSEDNTLVTQTTGDTSFSPFFLTAQAIPVGKWYFEFQYTGSAPGSNSYISVIPGDRRVRHVQVGSSGLNDSGLSWRSEGALRNQFSGNGNVGPWPAGYRMGYEVEVFANGSVQLNTRGGNGAGNVTSVNAVAAGSYDTGVYIAASTGGGPGRTMKLLERTEDFLYTPTAGYLPLNDVPTYSPGAVSENFNFNPDSFATSGDRVYGNVYLVNTRCFINRSTISMNGSGTRNVRFGIYQLTSAGVVLSQVSLDSGYTFITGNDFPISRNVNPEVLLEPGKYYGFFYEEDSGSWACNRDDSPVTSSVNGSLSLIGSWSASALTSVGNTVSGLSLSTGSAWRINARLVNALED